MYQLYDCFDILRTSPGFAITVSLYMIIKVVIIMIMVMIHFLKRIINSATIN